MMPATKNSVKTLLVFDPSNRIRISANDSGSYDVDGGWSEARPSHLLLRATIGEVETDIFCLIEPQDPEAEYISIHQLLLDSASEQKPLSGRAQLILAAINPELYKIPYLEMGENEYIYRFRTARERNRKIYVDQQSDALYQSRLCSVIKAARRTKEKCSGEPAVIDFGPVSYVIPSHFGFCLGVQNAIERAYEAVAANPGKRVFMLSELIHNPFVNADLLARGLRYLQTDKGLPLNEDGLPALDSEDPQALWNQLTEEDIVIIPAFGATNEDKARLIRYGISVRQNDATCMLVEKVWKAARRYAREGYTVLIHGKSEHEETKATFSNSSSHGPALMIRTMEHAQRLGDVIVANDHEKKILFERYFSGLHSKGFDPVEHLEKVAVVNQTTLLRKETLKIIDYLRDVIAKKYGEDRVAEHLWSKGKGDTLCYATQVNQDALQKAIDYQVDTALVVGGKNSSNTFQLYRVCKERFGEKAHYIQSEANILSVEEVLHYVFPYNQKGTSLVSEEVRPFLVNDGEKKHILLTGGASCPDGIIQHVIQRINSFFPKDSLRSIESILDAFDSKG